MCILQTRAHVCMKFQLNLLFKAHGKPWKCESYSLYKKKKLCPLLLCFFFYILRKFNILLHTHHAVSFLSSASLCRRWSAFSCFLSSFLDLDATFRANSLCFSSLSLYLKNMEMINSIWVYGNIKVSIVFVIGIFQYIIFVLTLSKKSAIFVTTHSKQFSYSFGLWKCHNILLPYIKRYANALGKQFQLKLKTFISASWLFPDKVLCLIQMNLWNLVNP